ncbi:TPA: hypothetical protein SME21_003100 [Klebsiella oxytoca]|nr:hypothetical protein [Klebsiella oxytoca]
MIRITMDIKDNFYKLGLESILDDILTTEFNKQMSYSHGLFFSNINSADITILSLCNGEVQLCQPFLANLNHGLLIVLTDTNTPKTNNLPLCCRNITYINTSNTIEEVKNILTSKIKYYLENGKEERFCISKSCNFWYVNYRQKSFLYNLIAHEKPLKIAKELTVSPREIYSKKRSLMNRFGIKTDCELVSLMNRFIFWMNIYQEKSYYCCWHR